MAAVAIDEKVLIEILARRRVRPRIAVTVIRIINDNWFLQAGLQRRRCHAMNRISTQMRPSIKESSKISIGQDADLFSIATNEVNLVTRPQAVPSSTIKGRRNCASSASSELAIFDIERKRSAMILMTIRDEVVRGKAVNVRTVDARRLEVKRDLPSEGLLARRAMDRDSPPFRKRDTLLILS